MNQKSLQGCEFKIVDTAEAKATHKKAQWSQGAKMSITLKVDTVGERRSILCNFISALYGNNEPILYQPVGLY
jgi:hypothetical protein